MLQDGLQQTLRGGVKVSIGITGTVDCRCKFIQKRGDTLSDSLGPVVICARVVNVINRSDLVSIGNAVQDGKQGWFAGQFISTSFGLVRQKAVEMKWGQHAKGERRRAFAQSPRSSTISILVSGSFAVQLKLPDGTSEIILATPGDYVAFGPGVYHSWEALEDCLVITVRFPSVSER